MSVDCGCIVLYVRRLNRRSLSFLRYYPLTAVLLLPKGTIKESNMRVIKYFKVRIILRKYEIRKAICYMHYERLHSLSSSTVSYTFSVFFNILNKYTM
ncbi:hypothetical protein T4C_5136 [Trichinella pseudospiralis]|uniref:Uncharacterized protein n=1 Tax=Trichinella pseudospiralis TaxID=6337 RepID=A0A0V1JG95_TRIPS|nr:hypothetical protein T4C_5136 [Trichinella pseudospiralis]